MRYCHAWSRRLEQGTDIANVLSSVFFESRLWREARKGMLLPRYIEKGDASGLPKTEADVDFCVQNQNFYGETIIFSVCRIQRMIWTLIHSWNLFWWEIQEQGRYVRILLKVHSPEENVSIWRYFFNLKLFFLIDLHSKKILPSRILPTIFSHSRGRFLSETCNCSWRPRSHSPTLGCWGLSSRW